MVWKSPPEQIQNTAKGAEYLKENYSGSSREKQLIALCWALANSYHVLLNTVEQYLQPEGKENKSANAMVSQAAVKTKGQLKPIDVTPAQRRKYKTKYFSPVDDSGETGLLHTAEDSELKIITKSLSWESLRNVWKDRTWQTDEPILSWLIGVWATTADYNFGWYWRKALGIFFAWCGHWPGDHREARTSPPLNVTLNKCEGEIPLPGRLPAATRPLENHGERNPMLERSCCARDNFLK